MLSKEIHDSTDAGDERTVFLIDVDNTLLDNDQFGDDLRAHLTALFGEEQNDRYWAIYDERRERLGYADYLGTLEHFRLDLQNHPQIQSMSAWLLEYPFEDRVYPQALEVIEHLRTLGQPVILSDGDIVLQPRKVQRSGLGEALRGEVLIYLHKQEMIEPMRQRYPAAHYVMIDDKPNILADMKRVLGDRLTTVFVRQGHYANEAGADIDPAPDRRISSLAELLGDKLEDYLPASRQNNARHHGSGAR